MWKFFLRPPRNWKTLETIVLLGGGGGGEGGGRYFTRVLRLTADVKQANTM